MDQQRRISRYRVGEALLWVGSMAVLFIAVIAIDWRTREKVTSFVQDRPFRTLGSGAAWMEGLGSALLDAIRYQALEHAPLTVFFVAAVVLMLFMIRT